ncbi:H/ACA ribonucleoprotein complex subunit 2-like protein isoform X2 [Notolabrus celidotus]|uniref:H/ACA ribonucleoprotein complex subunit 2-like protein isoform X2 n=1 Tax=Notolabrus celidotus TaxID=1203425 RepID=UPI00148FBA01|nr:H/ACA ribonucleoprotein complex subunit 2-like protein isoform X2 [Notolabrus celidotus]
MTKTKKEKLPVDGEEVSAADGPERSYQDLIANVNPIAQPLASKKLSKKLYKCVKKAAKVKNICRGVKEVQKFINKGEKGIVVLAGDTLPIDVYCHLPVMCEDRNLPYAYIPSKVDLGSSAGSKRPTCVILIKPHQDYQESYDECLEEDDKEKLTPSVFTTELKKPCEYLVKEFMSILLCWFVDQVICRPSAPSFSLFSCFQSAVCLVFL